MEKLEGKIGLRQRLANRLYPMSLAISLLIGLGFPALHYLLGYSSARQTGIIYAQELSQKLSDFVLENPVLWKYQNHQYNKVLDKWLPEDQVTAIHVRDEAGNSLPQYDYTTEQSLVWWNRYAPVGSAPIMFNNRQVGTVELQVSQKIFLGKTFVLLLVSSFVGIVLGVLVYYFPLKIVQRMEGQIQDLIGQLQALLVAEAQSTKQANFLADIATFSTRDCEDLMSLFNKLVQGTQQILKAERVFLYRFNRDGSGYIAAEAVAPGWPSCLNMKILDIYFTKFKNSIKNYKATRLCVINDIYKAGLAGGHVQLYEELGIRANVIAPIVKSDQFWGLICTQQCSKPRRWQQSEIDFLKQLTTELGLILDRMALLEQKEAEAFRAQLTKEITLRISQSLNLEDILNTAVEAIRLALKTDRVVVYGCNEKWQRTVIAESVAQSCSSVLGVQIDQPYFQNNVHLYHQGLVTAIDNIYTAELDECYIKQLEQFAVKASLVVPIVQDDELFGLLIAHQCDRPLVWQQAQIDLFGQLATQIGFALERAALLEQQRIAKEQLQQRVLELLMEVEPVSKGDLTIRAKVTEDEIGTLANSYNTTVSSLRSIVTQVQAATLQVLTTTSSSETSVQELSQEALQQAQEILATLARIQEMANSSHAVAKNATLAETAVQQAANTVEEGDAAMNRTVKGMIAIRETVTQTAKKMKRLGESSQKISKVVNLINSFAEQTNVLAVNASLEAARAGKDGQGFVVIADQVQTLAHQSTEATAEIESLVTAIQAETHEVVAAMEAGTQQVVTGTKLVDETRQSLNKIAAASAEIHQLVEAIASQAVMQSQASEAVTKTMTNVAAIADHTATEATHLSASFQDLLAVASALQGSVGQFKVESENFRENWGTCGTVFRTQLG